jgi:urease accessory protein UreF
MCEGMGELLVKPATPPRAKSMLDQTSKLPQRPAEMLGDLAALAEQLGGADGLCQLPLAAVGLRVAGVDTWPALVRFLNDYAGQILVPHELPAITRAYGHATRYEFRELLAFDQSLGQSSSWQPFAEASRAVGRNQLRQLRPLRGERLVQRYLKATEEGHANAWHAVVFGLVLALYALPLRQGLMHFAQQTLGGFAQAASGSIRFTNADRQELLAGHARAVAMALEKIITDGSAKPN